MFSSTRKGDIGLHKSIAALLEMGLNVFIPVSESKPYDLLVEDEGKFYKVQVKYRKIRQDGSLTVEFSSKASHTSKGVIRKKITNEDVDIFCLFCPDTDKCYFFKPDDRSTLTLRFTESSNNQKIGINYAKDFENWPRS